MKQFLSLTLLTLAIAGCKPAPPAPPATPGAEVVATVNGATITRNTFNFYVKGAAGKPAAELTPEQRSELLDNLVRGELVAADAEKTGVTKLDETQAIMALSRLTVLQQAASQHYLKDRKATDAELKAEYDAQVKAMPQTDYHVRHILLASKEAAAAVIKKLDAGASFEKLARSESIDGSSKDKGGDLDWVPPEQMVNPLGQAIAILHKGQYTGVPVQTQYGWHVVRVEDTRPRTPPPFDSAKERLTQIVEGKKFKSYTDELVKTAKIEKKL
jgi:peptidyl-prolyl cis-trans isomerase C